MRGSVEVVRYRAANAGGHPGGCLWFAGSRSGVDEARAGGACEYAKSLKIGTGVRKRCWPAVWTIRLPLSLQTLTTVVDDDTEAAGCVLRA